MLLDEIQVGVEEVNNQVAKLRNDDTLWLDIEASKSIEGSCRSDKHDVN